MSTTITASGSPSASGAAQRTLVLLYGISVYTAFLGVFLYAIGFVAGAFVPKTIDSGPAVPLLEALLVNGLFLGLFAVQHTIMARPAFKAWWTRIIPAAAERSTFVLVTIAILAGMFWQWRPIGGEVWSVESPLWSGVIYGIAALGWGLVLLATFLIDHFDLFGLRQVVLHFRGTPYSQLKFQERALYQWVRHPLLLGFCIAFWATPSMSWGHLFYAVMTTLYMFVGIAFEERDLIGAHGDSYREYRRRVPMLLPIRKPRSA